jgi:peptidoglycan/LPS O-acetylase OafA/YrhL
VLGLRLALCPPPPLAADAVGRFAGRRAQRILPPYWAALAFSLAVAG